MLNSVLSRRFTNIILEAMRADENGLKALRKKIMKAVSIFGARQFVTVTAEVLKDNFHIQGCNDARVPLKRIFNISLDELREALSRKDYRLPEGHPIMTLSSDHRDNVDKLKEIILKLDEVESDGGYIRAEDVLVDYQAEIDLHITKEEEVLFPVLEKCGMDEHPDNLKEEHKGFRSILSDTIEVLKGPIPEGRELVIKKISEFKDKFIPDISNHMFRETYIFYPAALEFITEVEKWQKIKEAFNRI